LYGILLKKLVYQQAAQWAKITGLQMLSNIGGAGGK
jgi:hypothetical protein